MKAQNVLCHDLTRVAPPLPPLPLLPAAGSCLPNPDLANVAETARIAVVLLQLQLLSIMMPLSCKMKLASEIYCGITAEVTRIEQLYFFSAWKTHC